MSDQRLRVLIVAADALTRAGLAAILQAETGLHAVGQLQPTDDLEHALAVFRPDILLWDVGYGDATLDRLLEYAQTIPGDSAPPVLALLADNAAAAPLLNAGVTALLLRSVPAPTLAAALHTAALRLVVLDPQLVPNILAPAPATDALSEPLTSRELEVLNLLAQGLPNKTIARQLRVSEHTVKFHVNAILTKLGAQSRTEAVVVASRAGIILL